MLIKYIIHHEILETLQYWVHVYKKILLFGPDKVRKNAPLNRALVLKYRTQNI